MLQAVQITFTAQISTTTLDVRSSEALSGFYNL